MAHDRVRSVGLQRVTGEDVEADAVAAPERPHRPRREERGRDARAEADVAHDAVEVDRERLDDVRDEEGQPDKGRVVLDRPRRTCDELVAALTANDPQRRGGEEDDVRREKDRDAQGAFVHVLILWGWSAAGESPK